MSGSHGFALPNSARLARAMARHTAAVALADAHLAEGSALADATAEAEHAALGDLDAAMASAHGWADVLAVLAHGERQSAREHEPGIQVHLLRALAFGLAARCFGERRAAAA